MNSSTCYWYLAFAISARLWWWLIMAMSEKPKLFWTCVWTQILTKTLLIVLSCKIVWHRPKKIHPLTQTQTQQLRNMWIKFFWPNIQSYACFFVFVNVPVFHSQVQMFFNSIKEQASQLRATQVALDNLQKNVRWCQRNLETLRNWLTKQMKWRTAEK